MESGNVGLVKEFWKANINIDLMYQNGSEAEMAIHIVASSGKIGLESLLLAHGSSVDILKLRYRRTIQTSSQRSVLCPCAYQAITTRQRS